MSLVKREAYSQDHVEVDLFEDSELIRQAWSHTMDLFMAMGYTFSAPKHLAAIDATFVWVTFYLTIPPVLISWVFPKLGAYWILANTAISASIWVVRNISWYLAYRRNPYTLETPIAVGVFLELVSMAVFFWGGKLFFAWGLLYFSGAGASEHQKSV